MRVHIEQKGCSTMSSNYEAVKKYQKSRDLFHIRPTAEEGQAIRDYATQTGQSVQGLFLTAIREYIKQNPLYRVKPEYYDAWYGNAPTSEITGIVALNDITRLAAEWGMPVEELMEQVEELD